MRLASLLPIVLLALPSLAQTGSLDPTAEELAGLRTAAPPVIELLEERVVDLRRWLPPVGTQALNDCTAWAVGYAAKSFLEARDQGWRPDAPERIFSPSFLYNQVNGGKDEGSNFVKMVRVMAERGAATLATAPYLPKDFTSQPAGRALAEAAAYPVLDLQLLRDRRSIRRALQRRQVVVFGAHVNPIFLSGRFERYGPDVFVKDCRLRQADQPHGKHAMVVVGYDDARGCFLIQNSWGPRWGERGYAWLQYELFDEIRIARDDSVFCNWACTIEDVEQPVVPSRGDEVARPQPVDRQALKVGGHADISRYDRDLGRFVYVFSADLRGPRPLLEQVREVAWTWIDEQDAERRWTSDGAATRFALLAGTTRNPLPLRGTVTFADGTSQAVGAELVGPNPKADFRAAKVVFTDDYHGPGPGGAPLFWWEATLDVPLEQRDDVVEVVWNVGAMNTRDPVQRLTGFNGRPATERAFGICQQPNRITATVRYVDGGIQQLQFEPGWSDAVEETFRIEVDKRRIGSDAGGRPSWSWTLTVDRPHRRQFDVERVDWTIDPWFTPCRTTTNATFAKHALFGTASRDFRAIATLHLRGGGTQVLEHWVELGPGTAYPDDDRIEPVVWNRYLGGEGGQPAFSGHVLLAGDRRQLEKLAKVFVREPAGADQREYEIATDRADPTWQWSCEGGPTAVLEYRLVFTDGREKRLRHEHRRTLGADDTLGFFVDMAAEPDAYLDPQHPATHRFTARPVGPDQSLLRVVAVDWQHEPIGYRERTMHAFKRTGLLSAHALTSVLTRPFPLRARLYYHTGWEESLATDLTRLAGGELRPDLALRVQEKFHGYHGGRPLWSQVLEVARDAAVWPAPVVKAAYTLAPLDGGPATVVVATTPTGACYTHAARPSRIRAEVEFADGRTATLHGFASTTAMRRKQPVSLIRYANNHGVDHEKRWLLVVDAWEGTREQLASVRWDSSAPEAYFDRTDDFAGGVPGLIVYERSSDPETMTVVANLRDGRSWRWEVAVGQPIAPVGWTWASTYWGDGLWQVDAEATGDWWHLQHLGRSFRLDGGSGLRFTDVGAWPLGRVRAHAKAGRHVVVGGAFRGDEPLPGATIELGGAGVATPERLALAVVRSPYVHEQATVPEWFLTVTGPERELREIVRVDYDFADVDGARTVAVDRRWGEFFAAYEHRTFGVEPPRAKARVLRRDGTVVEL